MPDDTRFGRVDAPWPRQWPDPPRMARPGTTGGGAEVEPRERGNQSRSASGTYGRQDRRPEGITEPPDRQIGRQQRHTSAMVGGSPMEAHRDARGRTISSSARSPYVSRDQSPVDENDWIVRRAIVIRTIYKRQPALFWAYAVVAVALATSVIRIGMADVPQEHQTAMRRSVQ